MKIRNLVIAGLMALGMAGLSVGCAADPKDVCSHIEKLAAKEIGGKMAKKTNEGCVKRWKRHKEMKGYFKYRTNSRCVMKAKKLDDLKKCS